MSPLDHLTEENRKLLAFAQEWEAARFEPERFRRAFLPPCPIKVLLVADGDLDFSMQPFGLRAFVETLLNAPKDLASFEITVAHFDSKVTDDEVMNGDERLSGSIKGFQFDNVHHFNPKDYDQVWLFGFASIYLAGLRGNDSQGQPYPPLALGRAELQALGAFMDGGGGVFAAGDHGSMGLCMSGSVPRVRSMRIWDDIAHPGVISMSTPQRNDTNQLGHDSGSQAENQSDDIPQTIQPKMYQGQGGFLRVAYPHPLLCGRNGIIRVLPDHPHEGECVEPANPDPNEYPPGVNGSARPLPEIIATSAVVAGMKSGSKEATDAQCFGAICAYDGHRAGVGRVVTQASWHHFTNLNLIGDWNLPVTDRRRYGFLYSAQGQAHLEEIKTYHRNLAFWLARPKSIRCMNERLCWQLLWHHRVIEAVTTRTDVTLGQADVRLVRDIGRHARDVLEQIAGQCLSWKLALDLASPFLDEPVRRKLDPWAPGVPDEPGLPWLDPQPLLDSALGGALLAMRERFPVPASDARMAAQAKAEVSLGEVAARGAAFAMEAAMRSLDSAGQLLGNLRNGLRL